jgi:hypothetical protein
MSPELPAAGEPLIRVEQGIIDDETEVLVIELGDLHGRTWIE